ncbi:uncharacterized protein BX663DRAFT_509027 [Cokeromyces recurvatus]|uniref:uncharacterized protein n=1 Tax=Cokeromyces recurvatus TaxID=90255 RepID=UPI00221FF352|nr:uncharacterized protein BX663DRAFT_509027 [Cokeromyces recurvatus]KAI7902960.1 hypothetical protein BX663DRAFT_509027 [Cokeromyces recurvatus]
MGQGESKLNDSFTFAYLLEPNKNDTMEYSHTSSLNDNNNDSLILTRPEIYGLTSSLPSSLNTSNNHTLSTISSLTSLSEKSICHQRPDSGYRSPSYKEDRQLAGDLGYIDKTYYHHSVTNEIQPPKEDMNDNEEYHHHVRRGGKTNRISFADIMLAASDKAIEDVYLPSKSIRSLSHNIGLLTMVHKLDLSNNHLTELPESIGYMQSLEILLLSRNQLLYLPDTIGYLSNLLELDVSYNQLKQLTPCISYLNKLKHLSLAFNQISKLPVEIIGLFELVSLDLTQNPLKVLPAEISQLPFLRRLRLENCPFQNEGLSYPLKHNPPSLLEICARNLIRSKKGIIGSSLPQHLIHYIKSAKSCTTCHGPYIESYVLRGRLMEKLDMQIPLEYTLCSAHWSYANDRILSMFSTQPETSSDFIHLPYLPILPQQSIKKKERLVQTNTNNYRTNHTRSYYSSSCSSTTTIPPPLPPPLPLDTSHISFITFENNIFTGNYNMVKLNRQQQQRRQSSKLVRLACKFKNFSN